LPISCVGTEVVGAAVGTAGAGVAAGVTGCTAGCWLVQPAATRESIRMSTRRMVENLIHGISARLYLKRHGVFHPA
jgi:hypothetical protein